MLQNYESLFTFSFFFFLILLSCVQGEAQLILLNNPWQGVCVLVIWLNKLTVFFSFKKKKNIVCLQCLQTQYLSKSNLPGNMSCLNNLKKLYLYLYI